jgi:hypothetical protein
MPKIWDELSRRCVGLAEHTFLNKEATWGGDLHLCLATLNEHSALISTLGGFICSS